MRYYHSENIIFRGENSRARSVRTCLDNVAQVSHGNIFDTPIRWEQNFCGPVWTKWPSEFRGGHGGRFNQPESIKNSSEYTLPSEYNSLCCTWEKIFLRIALRKFTWIHPFIGYSRLTCCDYFAVTLNFKFNFVYRRFDKYLSALGLFNMYLR